jgi:hypothetical protein
MGAPITMLDVIELDCCDAAEQGVSSLNRCANFHQ